MFDMEPVIESILSQLGAVAGRPAYFDYFREIRKLCRQADSLLNFKGLLGSRAAGDVIFIEYMRWSLKAFCNFVSKSCLAAAGVHMICVSVC